MLKEDNKDARRRQAELAAAMQAVVRANIAAILKVVTPQRMAEELDVTEQAVSGWKRTGKVAPHYFARIAELGGWTLDEFLSPAGKTDARTSPRAAESGPSYSPMQPIGMADALDKLAEVLSALNEDGREHASTVLSRLAQNPSGERLRTSIEMLETLARLHPRDPDPEPPAPRFSRKKVGTERRSDGKAQLTVKAGGGKRVQMGLPFKTVSDPWDESQAPQKERDWYGKWTASPKSAAGSGRKPKVRAK